MHSSLGLRSPIPQSQLFRQKAIFTSNTGYYKLFSVTTAAKKDWPAYQQDVFKLCRQLMKPIKLIKPMKPPKPPPTQDNL